MNRFAAFLVACLLALGIGELGYSRWDQITTKVWHWRYGYTTRVREYEVPVPDGWRVVPTDEDAPEFISLIFTGRTPDRGRFSGINEITIFSTSKGIPDLDAWQSYKRQWLEEQRVPNVQQRTLHIDGERVECLGGSEVSTFMHVPSVDIALECASNGKVRLLFYGQPSLTNQFYDIASRIHRQP